MRTLTGILKQARFFLVPYAIFFALAGTVLLLYQKPEIHLSINRHYSAFGDFIMPWITLMADGITITVLVLLLFALNRRFAFFTGIACLFSSAITQLLKHTYYYGVERPKLFFEQTHNLRLVPGIKNDIYDTFPSGHTTVAFAFLCCMALGVRNNYLKTFFCLLAVLIAYSRIYLSEHFLGDVFAGSFIGTTSALLVMTLAVQKNKLSLPLKHKSWKS